MGNKKIGLLGAGSQAIEIIDFAEDFEFEFAFSSSEDSRAFLNSSIRIFNLLSVDINLFNYPVVLAVGAPGLKKQLTQDWGGNIFESVISKQALISQTSQVGVGSVLAPHSVVMTNTTLGKFNLINIGATISHDTVIGDFATISPGVNVGGNCKIGDGVFLGIGSSVLHGVTISEGTYVGAGAVVTKDISVPGTYIGSPARMISGENIWSKKI